MKKQVVYLGGGWTDTEPEDLTHGMRLIKGAIYTIDEVDADGDLWVIGNGLKSSVCESPEFFKEVIPLNKKELADLIDGEEQILCDLPYNHEECNQLDPLEELDMEDGYGYREED